MTPEGFYRVNIDGFPGIGCCRHMDNVENNKYENWNILFLRAFPGGKEQWPTYTSIDSNSKSYAGLKIGSRIKGLPTSFRVPATDAQRQSTTSDDR